MLIVALGICPMLIGCSRNMPDVDCCSRNMPDVDWLL